MSLLFLFTLASDEWTGLGLTASDWAASLTLLLVIVTTGWKISAMVNKLTNSIENLNKTNRQLNESYNRLSRRIENHETRLVRTEERLNEAFHRIKEENKHD